MNRITFLTGYYGSGKTETATNLAVRFQADYLIDLDVINPYFRSRELKDILDQSHIKVISSAMEDTKYADMPYIGGDVFLPFLDHSKRAVFDLGGNDLGAKLLQQFGDYFDEVPVDLFLVVNTNRLETASSAQIVKLIERIESAGGIPVTGLINNTNMLHETTIEDIQTGEAILVEAATRSQRPIVYTMIPEGFKTYPAFQGTVIPFHRYFKPKWL
jgi:hypothetical protein